MQIRDVRNEEWDMPWVQKTTSKMRWFHWVALAVLVIIIGSATAIFIHIRDVNNQKKNTTAELRQVESEVGKLVILPRSETPALATITNPLKLKNDKFLSQGQAGDKVLIYPKWGQAIIYRPGVNKIVDIGPVNISAPGSNAGFNPVQ